MRQDDACLLFIYNIGRRRKNKLINNGFLTMFDTLYTVEIEPLHLLTGAHTDEALISYSVQPSSGLVQLQLVGSWQFVQKEELIVPLR